MGPAAGDDSSRVIVLVCGCDPRVGGELATMDLYTYLVMVVCMFPVEILALVWWSSVWGSTASGSSDRLDQ